MRLNSSIHVLFIPLWTEADLIDRMCRQGEKVGIYSISENAWLDMGQFDSMDSMERRLKELNIS